jgi:hypothetical protein
MPPFLLPSRHFATLPAIALNSCRNLRILAVLFGKYWSDQNRREMRNLYCLVVFLGLAAAVHAQSFTVREGTNRDTTIDAHGYVDFYVHFDNTFQQPITLVWEETSVNHPNGWLMTVCDNAACYTIPHGSDTMASVAQGQAGFLKITAIPQEIAGTATLGYHVYDANNPLYTANITMTITATGTSVTITQPSELFTVTPVPAHDVLHLTARSGQLDKGNVKLFDLKGQLVLDQAVFATSSTEMDVHSLKAGMYMLRYESKAGLLTQKVVVTH